MSPAAIRTDAWVLVVEDDAEFRAQICTLLQSMRLRFVEARSPSEATSKLEKQKFGLVLLDLWLEKGKLGLKVIDSMRDSPHNFNVNTPVLIMSGFLDAAMMLQIGSKVSAIMVKPFTPEDLRRKLLQLLPAPAPAAAGGA